MNYENIMYSIKSFLEPFKDEFGVPFINSIQANVDKYNLDVIFKDNKNGLLLGITVATLVFVISKTKVFNVIKTKFIPDKDMIDEKEAMRSIKAIMEHENIDFDAAREILIANELASNLRINKDTWVVNDKKIIQSCDKVSFRDKEIGLVSGYFIGLIKPDYLVYDDIYVMRLRDGTLRQAPISCVEVDSIYVYKNSNYTFED